METQRSPKIPFYVQRSFSEKMNVAFDFIKENWKTVFKYATYLILPLCLIQSLSVNAFIGSYMGFAMEGAEYLSLGTLESGFLISYGLTVFFSILGTLMMTSLLYALVKLYNDRSERLVGVDFSMIRPLLFRNMGRLFLMGIVMVGMYILLSMIVGVLMALSPWTLIITLPLLFAFAVALTMWAPVYLFENIGIGDAFSKGLRLGIATWGGVFAVIFVMALIAFILQGVVMTPWYIAVGVKSLFIYSEGTADETSVLYNVMVYVLGVIQVFGAYLAMIFGILGLSYQYAHATEKLDSITVESEIDNFENL